MNNFEYGFITKCAEYGVDPDMLIKVAARIPLKIKIPAAKMMGPTRLASNRIITTGANAVVDPSKVKVRGLLSYFKQRGIKNNNAAINGNLASYVQTNNLPGFKNVSGGKVYSKGIKDQQLAHFDDVWNRNQKFLSGKYGGDKNKYIQEQMSRNFYDDIASINNTRNALSDSIVNLGNRNQALLTSANSGLTRLGDIAGNTLGVAALGGAGLYGYNQLAGNPNNDSGYVAAQPQPQPSIG